MKFNTGASSLVFSPEAIEEAVTIAADTTQATKINRFRDGIIVSFSVMPRVTVVRILNSLLFISYYHPVNGTARLLQPCQSQFNPIKDGYIVWVPPVPVH
ncbi:uncharacterized protein METZ01_LOCUS514940 [marine metagenome]|uniref:Uncharacterized protein n=1 Tax=marine metagenome TaxID=408172 RepID=A0A383EYX2_9ZZZZ